MSNPSYGELSAQHEGHWITYGPNSDGQEGWFLYQGQMFYYGGSWGMAEPMVSPGISIEEFITQHQNQTEPRVLRVVEELRSKLK